MLQRAGSWGEVGGPPAGLGVSIERTPRSSEKPASHEIATPCGYGSIVQTTR